MASEQTANFGLNQWAAEDRIIREEFNADNAKIDAGLMTVRGEIPRIVCGVYTGDGAESQKIELGFTPRTVYSSYENGNPYTSDSGYTYCYGGLAVPDHPVIQREGYPVLAIEEGGFRVYYGMGYGNSYIRSNTADEVYHYVAVN